MLGEINKDFYCSAKNQDAELDLYCRLDFSKKCFEKKQHCSCYHRKHPTPEQFLEEYGKKWNGAVYVKCTNCCDEGCYKDWLLYDNEQSALADMCATATEEADPIIICACTPYGKPDKDWRSV